MAIGEIVPTFYKCAVCGHVYDTKDEAESCSSRPVSQDKGVGVGDTVLITSGDGRGETATVFPPRVS